MAFDRARLRRFAPFASVLFFAVALWLLHNEVRGFRYRDVRIFLETLPRHRLAEAVLWTVAGYLALSLYDALALRYSRISLPYGRIVFASFTASSFSNTLGYPLFTG